MTTSVKRGSYFFRWSTEVVKELWYGGVAGKMGEAQPRSIGSMKEGGKRTL